MLRFRRDRLYIGLEPDRLTLVRMSGRLSRLPKPPILASAVLPLDESAAESTRSEALRKELGNPQWQGAESHLVLADRLIRYFLVKRPEGARNLEEVRLAAGLRYEDIFGVPADEWEIQLDLTPFASDYLGCALRKSFVADAVAACSEAKSPLVTLQPFAVSEFNRSGTQIGQQDGWFAVPGRHSLWLGQKKGCNWLAAHQQPMKGDVAGEFPRILAQECLRAPSTSCAELSQVWVSGFLGDAASRQCLASIPARLLGAAEWPGQSAGWSATYRLALSSVWPACA